MLEKQFGETIGNNMKIAIMASMLPPVIQDFVYQTVTSDMLFDTLLDKVRAWVSNRVAMDGGSTPMDIGEVEWNGYEEDQQVDAVGTWTRCHKCEGWGHLARECPTKGKGKDGKSGAKGGQYQYVKSEHNKGGYSKGDGKGNYGKGGKGPKGAGKGYQGTCWRCGTVGHKAAECTRQVQIVEEAREEIVEEVGVGGVWMIGAVETVWRKPKNPVKPVTTQKFCEGFNINYNNKYQELSTYDEDEADESDCGDGSRGDSPKECCPKDAGSACARSGVCCGSTINNRTNNNHNNKDASTQSVCKDFNVVVDEVLIGAVEGNAGGTATTRRTRTGSLKFHVAGVQRPLASAAKVVGAGNRIVMGPDDEGSFIENMKTGERMKLRIERGTYVFDVKYTGGTEGTITLDSGAGVNVLPEGMLPEVPMRAPEPGLRMIAANGTEIPNVGCKVVEFSGQEPVFSRRA